MGLGAIGGVGALVGAGTSIAGGIMGRNAAQGAASAESNAISQGLAFSQGVYNNAQGNLNPYIGGGQQALQSLLGFYGLGNNPQGAQAGFQQFTQTPTYQFAQQQGLLAANRQLAAAGLSGSGAAVKEASQYNQGLASQGLQSYLSGLSTLAGSGQQAAGTLAQAGGVIGNQVMQGYTNQGLALGGGIVGANNALQQGLQGAFGPFGSVGSQSSYNLSSLGSGLNNLWGNLTNTYTGPAIGSLSGNAATMQGQLGLGPGQYVP